MKRSGKRETRYLFFGACLSALLLACVMWITFDFLFLPLKRDGETVTVGDYSGDVLSDATFEDWMTVRIEYRNDRDVPAGVILSQTPSAGSRRKLTDVHPTVELTLTVSLGKEHAILPNVVGKDVREAERMLRDLGFSVELTKKESAYDTGTVFGMSPSEGTELPCGETVKLTVSAGKPETIVRVPNVCGMTRGEALTELWLSELSVKEVIEEETEFEDRDGIVIRQSHVSGTLVRAGTAVTIYVSGYNSSHE